MMNETQKAKSLKAFARAIKEAGGQLKLSMTLGCSQARISRILAGESPLDGELAARIHRDIKVPRWELRPDLFEVPKGAESLAPEVPRKRLKPAKKQPREKSGKPRAATQPATR